MQRLTHLVMLLALLFSGPVLPAWVMPCCNGPASLAKTAKAAAPHEDAMEGMPSCHHTAAATTIDCAHAACLHQNENSAPASQALAHSGDADATPTHVESHLPSLTTRDIAPPRALHPPSPPTAMPLPLRV